MRSGILKATTPTIKSQDGKLRIAGRLVSNPYVEDKQSPHITLPSWEGVLCIGSYVETGGKLYAFEDHTSLLHTVEAGATISLGRLPIAHARLLADHKGQLWAAGSYGVGPVNTEKPEDTPVYQTASTELYCLFEDRQGNLWVGGDNGLSVLCPALQQVRTLSSTNITALLEDHTGKIWMGRAEDRVSSLYEDRSGTRTWACGTTPAGRSGRTAAKHTRTALPIRSPRSR
ncbi:MAG: hypothetical protein J5917_08920 [Bacteroidales bacterium]|nr:hypothetical protein [Bacteroidales bacterium]